MQSFLRKWNRSVSSTEIREIIVSYLRDKKKLPEYRSINWFINEPDGGYYYVITFIRKDFTSFPIWVPKKDLLEHFYNKSQIRKMPTILRHARRFYIRHPKKHLKKL